MSRFAMNKALLLMLSALLLVPVAAIEAAPVMAHPPGWRAHYRPGPRRYGRWYGPVHRPRWGPVVVLPPAPEVVYFEAPPQVVYVEPPRRFIVREAPPAVSPAPAPQVYQQPAPSSEAPERDFLGLGVHVTGASLAGEKVGISTAENPGMGGLGFHVRGRFSEDFGLELSADFLSGSADNMQLEQSTIPVMAGLTWHILPTSRFQPYLVAGAGVHFTRLAYFGGDYNIDITELAGQLGGGVELFISEHLALHADLRFQSIFKDLDTKEKIATDCIAQVGTQSGFCDNIHYTGAEDKVDLGAQLQLGASWYF